MMNRKLFLVIFFIFLVVLFSFLFNSDRINLDALRSIKEIERDHVNSIRNQLKSYYASIKIVLEDETVILPPELAEAFVGLIGGGTYNAIEFEDETKYSFEILTVDGEVHQISLSFDYDSDYAHVTFYFPDNYSAYTFRVVDYDGFQKSLSDYISIAFFNRVMLLSHYSE